MAHTHTQEAHGHEEHGSSTKVIWRTFWILLVLTVVELAFAIIHDQTGFPNKYFLNFVFALLTLAKAFYIVAEFMHLGHENKNFIMSITISLLLLVWAVIAFLADGNSYKNLRNNYDRFSHDYHTTPIPGAPVTNHGAGAVHEGAEH